MKRLLLFLTAVLLNVSPAYAAPFTASGTVYILRSHATALGVDMDWFSLVGVTSLGVCKTADAGYVVLRLRDDAKGQRMYSIVLAAKNAGTPVHIVVDDTVTDSGSYCYVRSVFIQ